MKPKESAAALDAAIVVSPANAPSKSLTLFEVYVYHLIAFKTRALATSKPLTNLKTIQEAFIALLLKVPISLRWTATSQTERLYGQSVEASLCARTEMRAGFQDYRRQTLDLHTVSPDGQIIGCASFLEAVKACCTENNVNDTPKTIADAEAQSVQRQTSKADALLTPPLDALSFAKALCLKEDTPDKEVRAKLTYIPTERLREIVSYFERNSLEELFKGFIMRYTSRISLKPSEQLDVGAASAVSDFSEWAKKEKGVTYKMILRSRTVEETDSESSAVKVEFIAAAKPALGMHTYRTSQVAGMTKQIRRDLDAPSVRRAKTEDPMGQLLLLCRTDTAVSRLVSFLQELRVLLALAELDATAFSGGAATTVPRELSAEAVPDQRRTGTITAQLQNVSRGASSRLPRGSASQSSTGAVGRPSTQKRPRAVVWTDVQEQRARVKCMKTSSLVDIMTVYEKLVKTMKECNLPQEECQETARAMRKFAANYIPLREDHVATQSPDYLYCDVDDTLNDERDEEANDDEE